jgi:hypothetical protein
MSSIFQIRDDQFAKNNCFLLSQMASSIMIVRLCPIVSFNNRAGDIYITEASKLCISKGVANL